LVEGEIIMVPFLLLVSLVAADKCRSLVLEGGGAFGAYQAGAIAGLVAGLPTEETAYDVITGVSVGALNAAAFTQYAKGDEDSVVALLSEVWRSFTSNSQIYTEWPGTNLLEAVLTKPSLFTNEPLKDLVASILVNPLVRKVSVGATNLDTGKFELLNETLGVQGFAEATICSSAIEGVFPHQQFLNATWGDGGAVMNLDPFTAVTRCMQEYGASQDDIIVDLVFCSSTKLADAMDSLKTPDVISRSMVLHEYDTEMWYLFQAKRAYPRVNFRYVVMPSEALAGNVLNFTQTPITANWAIGLKDAEAALSGNSLSSDAMVRWMSRSDRVRLSKVA
jgi:predicted acylesterase/phospholipase RssA